MTASEVDLTRFGFSFYRVRETVHLGLGLLHFDPYPLL